jgi:hypothetical protein
VNHEGRGAPTMRLRFVCVGVAQAHTKERRAPLVAAPPRYDFRFLPTALAAGSPENRALWPGHPDGLLVLGDLPDPEAYRLGQEYWLELTLVREGSPP